MVAELRALSRERQVGLPAYLIRTRFERALLALCAKVSVRAYGSSVTGIRRHVVERYLSNQPVRSPAADDLIRRASIVYYEFVGFTDVGKYSEDAQHPRIAQAEPELLELCDLAEEWFSNAKAKNNQSPNS